MEDESSSSSSAAGTPAASAPEAVRVAKEEDRGSSLTTTATTTTTLNGSLNDIGYFEATCASEDDDDENDTLEESHSKNSALEDQDDDDELTPEAAKESHSANEDTIDNKKESNHSAVVTGDDDRSTTSKSGSSTSINNHRHEQDDGSSSSSEVSSCASSGSESDSESVTFESLQRDFENNKDRNSTTKQTNQAPEGAPSSSRIVQRRHADSSAAGRGRGLGGDGGGPGRGLGRGSGRGAAMMGGGRMPNAAPARIPRKTRTNSGLLHDNDNPLMPSASNSSRNSALDFIDDNRSLGSTGSRRSQMTRSATERFVYRPDPDDDSDNEQNPTDSLSMKLFKKKGRSLSVDLGTKLKEEEAKAKGGPVNEFNRLQFHPHRYTVMFGASREQSHYHPHVIRRSRKIDVQTGGDAYREVICQRIIDYPHPMDPNERRRKLVMRTGNDDRDRMSMHGNFWEPQYRLQSKIHATAFKEQISSQSVKPGFLTTYLTWSLRAPFPIVLLSEAFGWWAVICVFAICIYLGAMYQPQCLRVGLDGRSFEEAGSYFIDAFAVSWTTFATVGYGMVYPQVHREIYEKNFHCAFMTTLVSLESFLGVLFASFCGAVIVGKITRAKSTASVRFSVRMILRFGTGVMYTDDDDDRCDDRDEMSVSEFERNRSSFPCPVLEFRVANVLYANANGEILNSKLSVVGSTLAETADVDYGVSLTKSVMGVISGGRPSLLVLRGMKDSASQFIRKQRSMGDGNNENNSTLMASSINSLRRSFSAGQPKEKVTDSNEPKKKKKRVLKRLSLIGQDAIESAIKKQKILRPPAGGSPSVEHKLEQKLARKKPICVDEDPTGGLIPRKLFSSLKVECDTHPFFKRVWTVRHVLDADSPLLSKKAMRMIRESRGLWPAEACNHEFIRENVHFQQLIVSLSGTTGVNGCNVYGLHVYDYSNLHVGYTFAPMLGTTADGKLKVDLDGIDDIRIQRGGGEEPIDYYDNHFRSQSSIHTRLSNVSRETKRAQFRQSISKQLTSGSIKKTSTRSFADGDYEEPVNNQSSIRTDQPIREVSYHKVLRTSTR